MVGKNDYDIIPFKKADVSIAMKSFATTRLKKCADIVIDDNELSTLLKVNLQVETVECN